MSHFHAGHVRSSFSQKTTILKIFINVARSISIYQSSSPFFTFRQMAAFSYNYDVINWTLFRKFLLKRSKQEIVINEFKR